MLKIKRSDLKQNIKKNESVFSEAPVYVASCAPRRIAHRRGDAPSCVYAKEAGPFFRYASFCAWRAQAFVERKRSSALRAKKHAASDRRIARIAQILFSPAAILSVRFHG